MPELRSGARRGRAQANPVVQAERPSTRRRRGARNQQQPVDENPPPVTRPAERREEIGLVEGRGEVGGEENREGVGERMMNDCDSGARSGGKPPGGEEEGSTAPLPEKVRPSPFCLVSSVLLNFSEETTFFNCLINTTFYFCSTLGGIHGVPRVHYKGRQGDYYIMVLQNFFGYYLLYFQGSSSCLRCLHNFITRFCRLWICWDQVFGMYGIITPTRKMSVEMVACIAIEAISILEKMHSKG
ncbi:hypothetical protein GW17_00042668 [Ensete ventricosum]|nr:hypothetical protein GW17_00042668 [Ensete ventricosum]